MSQINRRLVCRPLSMLVALMMALSLSPTISLPHQALAASANVTAIPFGNAIPTFNGMTVTANDVNLQVAKVPVSNDRNWPAGSWKDSAVAMFDMTDGDVTVTVTKSNIQSCVVRPARANITPTVSGNTVSFVIKQWGQYTVEFNNDAMTDCLQVFANPPLEVKGEQITGERNDLTVNGEMTLMPGAVVRGNITINAGGKLYGRGVIYQTGPPAVKMWGANNSVLDGVCVFDQNNWGIEPFGADGVTINNVKLISSKNNGDGITIQSSRNVTITKSYVRSWDDSIVLKNYDRPISTSNINVKDCVLWTDLAQTVEIGFETNKFGQGESISNVLFEDIDIVHAYHKAPISIHNADRCVVSDITFKNIILDDAQMGVPGIDGAGWKYLIDFCNGDSSSMGGAGDWTHNNGNRTIKNVLVENVWVLGGEPTSCGSRFQNRDNGGTSSFENVQLKNIFWVPTREGININTNGLAELTNEAYFDYPKADNGDPTPASPAPSELPSDNPSDAPSDNPSDNPSDAPSDNPSDNPSDAPSDIPSDNPSDAPSNVPPSQQPSIDPSDAPSIDPNSPAPSAVTSPSPSDGNAPPSAPASPSPSALPGEATLVTVTVKGGADDLTFIGKVGDTIASKPAKAYYTLEGLYQDAAFKTKITTVTAGVTTVYAKFNPVTISVKYTVKNPGKVKSGKKSLKVAVGNKAAQPKVTVKGKKFKGFYTAKKGGKKVTKSTKLTAAWLTKTLKGKTTLNLYARYK